MEVGSCLLFLSCFEKRFQLNLSLKSPSSQLGLELISTFPDSSPEGRIRPLKTVICEFAIESIGPEETFT
jgi:hypothetical protein